MRGKQMSGVTFNRNRLKLKKLLGIRARLALLALVLVAPLMLDRVRWLEDTRTKQIALHRRIIEAWMIEPDRHRAEKSVEINKPFTRDSIVQVGAAALIQIDDNLKAVEQDVLPDGFKNF